MVENYLFAGQQWRNRQKTDSWAWAEAWIG